MYEQTRKKTGHFELSLQCRDNSLENALSPQDREYQQIEWKESWREDYFKWICGFANAQGGDLILGKGDQGQLVGLENAPWLLENLPNQIRDLLGIMVEVNLRVEQGLNLIEIRTPAYPNPHQLQRQFLSAHWQHQSIAQRPCIAALFTAEAGHSLGQRDRAASPL